MTPVTLPSKAPTPGQMAPTRSKLAELLHDLKGELLQRQLDLIKAGNAAELAAIVRATANNLAEASASWAEMSATIRESWRI